MYEQLKLFYVQNGSSRLTVVVVNEGLPLRRVYNFNATRSHRLRTGHGTNVEGVLHGLEDQDLFQSSGHVGRRKVCFSYCLDVTK